MTRGNLTSANFYGLHLLLSLMVLVFSVSVADQFALPKYAILQSGSLVLFALWLYWYFSSDGAAQVKHTGVSVLVVLFALAVSLSTLFAMDITLSVLGKYHRYEGLLTQFSYLVLFFLSVQLLHDGKAVYKHIKIMVLIAVAASVYGLIQFAGFDVFSWRVALGPLADQTMSTFGNRSFLGGFLVMALPLSIAWIFSSSGRERWLAVSAGLVVGATLVATETRASWIGAVVGLAFFAVLVRGRLRIRMGYLVAGVLLVVVLLASIIALSSQKFDRMREIALRATTVSVGSGSVRVETWKTALAMIADRPLLGTGPDAFRFLFTRFQSKRYSRISPWQTISDDAHNYFLNLASNLGLLGFLAMITLLIALLWKGAGGAFSAGGLPLVALLSSVVSYLSHLVFSVGHLASNAWMWVVLGILSVHLFPLQSGKRSEKRRAAGQFKIPLLVAALLVGLAGTTFAATRYLADFYFARAQRSLAAAAIDTAIEDFNRAIRLAPYYSGYREDLALLYVDLAELESDYRYVRRAAEVGEKSLQANAYNIDGYMVLANAYLAGAERFGNASDAQRAQDVLVRALEVKPQSALTHYFLARALLVQGKTEEAEIQLRQSLQVEPDYEKAKRLLVELGREKRVQD